MIRIYYEEYYNDYHRNDHEKSFYSIEELEEWIFGQMRQDYTDKKRWAMSFPTPKRVKSINESGPWSIEFKPGYESPTFWIHMIKNDQGIIFSDGNMTAKKKHWSKEIQDWLEHCENRRRNPQFNFVP